MHVLALNGSPRAQGNTFHAIRIVEDELKKMDINVDILHVGDKKIHGCTACGTCREKKNEECVIKDDPVNGYIQLMKKADGLLLASPVYYSGVAGTMKSFLDRTFFVSGANGNLMRHKVGAAIAALRRTGGMPAIDNLSRYLHYSEMFIPASNYWNVVHGANPGDLEGDEEGVQILRVLGKNMAWLMKVIESGKKQYPLPEKEAKIATNFIR